MERISPIKYNISIKVEVNDMIRTIENGEIMDITVIEETYPDDYILVLVTSFEPSSGRGEGIPVYLCTEDIPLLKKSKEFDKPSDTMIIQGRNLNPVLGGFM